MIIMKTSESEGTMPLEDSFYCFSMLYGSVLLFEYFRRKWNYSLSMSIQNLNLK